MAAHRAVLGIRDAVRPVDTRFSVTETPDLPVDRLRSLYRSHVPPGIHVNRSRRFYEWRVRDPLEEFNTYLVRTDRTVGAAVVVSERDGTVFVRDILPFDADRDAVRAGLAAVAQAHPDSEYLCAWCPASVDARALWSAGLVSSRVLPCFAYSTDIVVRSLDGRWSVAGRRLDDPAAWDIHLLARDY